MASEAAPAAGTALGSWPPGWHATYVSAIQLLRCDAPLESRLWTVPLGVGNLHPPGPVIGSARLSDGTTLDRAAAEKIIETWIAQPR